MNLVDEDCQGAMQYTMQICKKKQRIQVTVLHYMFKSVKRNSCMQIIYLFYDSLLETMRSCTHEHIASKPDSLKKYYIDRQKIYLDSKRYLGNSLADSRQSSMKS